jgi:hypothetical protein
MATGKGQRKRRITQKHNGKIAHFTPQQLFPVKKSEKIHVLNITLWQLALKNDHLGRVIDYRCDDEKQTLELGLHLGIIA